MKEKWIKFIEFLKAYWFIAGVIMTLVPLIAGTAVKSYVRKQDNLKLKQDVIWLKDSTMYYLKSFDRRFTSLESSISSTREDVEIQKTQASTIITSLSSHMLNDKKFDELLLFQQTLLREFNDLKKKDVISLSRIQPGPGN